MPRRKMKLSAREVAVILRVREQLQRMEESPPTVVPIDRNIAPTVEDYRQLDPLAETTMGGSLSGRVVTSFAQDFPKTSSVMAWIRSDLKKWPWARRDAR
jgi:hypothetical protein